MYIKHDLKNGYNSYFRMETSVGRLSMMDAGILKLNKGENYTFLENDKELAVLLIEGAARFVFQKEAHDALRQNPFDFGGYCMHVPRNTVCSIMATTFCEFYIQSTNNSNDFIAHLYTPDEISITRAGANGELQGTMQRNICTYFDYDNAPYSNMVLGEVINWPGRWSSYPPHHHPQPEIYYYRFDKPQGFGIGFANGEIFKTDDHGMLLITDGFHSQAAAPGYAMMYVWGIRHLPNDPWKKTRIDCPEHDWLLKKDAVIWSENKK